MKFLDLEEYRRERALLDSTPCDTEEDYKTCKELLKELDDDYMVIGTFQV
jgi:hypothetical protein